MFHPNGPTFLELARQALSSTEKGYDLLASKFNHTPFRTPDFVLERVVEILGAELTCPDAFNHVLDVCCGTGAGMQAIFPLCQKRLVGLDFSKGMLEVAERDFYRDGIDQRSETRLEFVYGDALEMSWENEFDLAITFGANGHILPRDQRTFVEQIFKSLKSGGQFAFVTSEMPSRLGATYWLSRGFNAAMHMRNFLIRPSFVMFYLTFLWPDVELILRETGFGVKVFDLFPDDAKLKLCKLVIASKP